MSEFAEFIPTRPSDVEPVADFHIENAERSDISCIAELNAAREGGSLEEHVEAIQRQFFQSRQTKWFFVALTLVKNEPIIVTFYYYSK